MRLAFVFAAVALGLSACAPAQDFRPSRPPPTAAPQPQPQPQPPRPTPVPPPPKSTPPPQPAPSADACGASQLQHLVGRPKTEVPIPLKPNLQRVACTACPVTQDYNPNRLNFFFDAATGIIQQVKCG